MIEITPSPSAAPPADVPPEHVFERSVLIDAPNAASLRRRALRLLADCERTACRVDGRRLQLTAEREEDLDRPIEILRAAFGPMLRASIVGARWRNGRRGPERPVLGVQVRCAKAHVDRVRRDLQRRDARIVEAGAEHGGVVRAVVPASQLVGYARQLAELSRGTAVHTTWLSHWEPLEPPSPLAASTATAAHPTEAGAP
jgi:hypothetical protein